MSLWQSLLLHLKTRVQGTADMGCDNHDWSEQTVAAFKSGWPANYKKQPEKLAPGFLKEPDPDKPVKNWINYREEEMMKNCPTCNTPLPESHSAFDLEAILAFVKKEGGWHRFEEGAYNQIKNFTLANGKKATVAASKTSYDKGDIDVKGYYGESALPQGSTFDTFIVIQVGDAFFKKTGTGDSYGEVSWNGDLMPVKAQQKTILVFE
jgi:hypothetical protein